MRFGNFLMTAVFSPHSHTPNGKEHHHPAQSPANGHSYGLLLLTAAKRVVFLLTLGGVTTAAVLCLLQPGQTYTDIPAWRDVSMFQIIKMHLAPRPSQVNRPITCPSPMPKPAYTISDMDAFRITFYDDVSEKLKDLTPDEQWKQSFSPALKRDKKLELVHLYAVFKHAMDAAGIGHIVLHGSALGAWRSHGITPWDDDIDIGIDAADWVGIKQTLNCIEGFSLVTTSNTKWYFYRNNGTFIPGDESTKRWPFLDLFLYSGDSNYVFGLNYVHLRKFTFRIEDVFPLQTVPFEGFMVPVPRHLRRVLEHQFIDPTVCVSQHLNHRNGTSLEVIKVPCTKLRELYTLYFTDN